MAGHVNERAKFHRVLALLIVALFAFAGYVGWNLYDSAHQANVATKTADSAKTRASNATDNAADLAQQVKKACREGSVKVKGQDICHRANVVAQHPEKPAPGSKGDTGSQGPVGLPGPRGAKGPKGDPGQRGPVGQDGEQGAQGVPGPLGKTGDDGATGQAGKPGQDGKQGAPGTNGKDGSAGPAGPKGDTGPAGKDGSTGPKGDTGPAGKDGKDGANGKDGVSIVKVECPANNDWKITLSDGTVQRISGPCRAPVPAPTTTP